MTVTTNVSAATVETGYLQRLQEIASSPAVADLQASEKLALEALNRIVKAQQDEKPIDDRDASVLFSALNKVSDESLQAGAAAAIKIIQRLTPGTPTYEATWDVFETNIMKLEAQGKFKEEVELRAHAAELNARGKEKDFGSHDPHGPAPGAPPVANGSPGPSSAQIGTPGNADAGETKNFPSADASGNSTTTSAVATLPSTGVPGSITSTASPGHVNSSTATDAGVTPPPDTKGANVNSGLPLNEATGLMQKTSGGSAVETAAQPTGNDPSAQDKKGQTDSAPPAVPRDLSEANLNKYVNVLYKDAEKDPIGAARSLSGVLNNSAIRGTQSEELLWSTFNNLIGRLSDPPPNRQANLGAADDDLQRVADALKKMRPEDRRPEDDAHQQLLENLAANNHYDLNALRPGVNPLKFQLADMQPGKASPSDSGTQSPSQGYFVSEHAAAAPLAPKQLETPLVPKQQSAVPIVR